MPRVTVIMATYNYAEVLPYSIGSILAQDFGDFEVLVIGDGCTDNSAEVVQGMADPRVKWFNLPLNTGQQAWPNNYALRQAKGDIIAYLGHDDLWMPHHLSVLVTAIDTGADMAFGITEVIFPDNRPPRAITPDPNAPWIPPTGVVHRKSVTDNIGGMRDFQKLKIDPETDLWNRIREAGYIVRFVPRLTALKLSSAHRKDIYREKPTHEHEKLAQRMREPDFERTELANMLLGRDQDVLNVPPAEHLKRFFRTLLVAFKRRLKFTRKHPILHRRVYKGLPEKSAAMEALQDPHLPFDFELEENED